MPKVNATWRLSQDPKTAQFTLRVEYKSGEPPEKHEKTHRRIVDKAMEMLHEYGLTDDQIKQTRIDIECISPSGEQPIPEPIPTPIPENQ